MAMHNPPHPGGIIRRQCLEPLGLSVTRAAEGLGVTRQTLSELVNENAGLSIDMATVSYTHLTLPTILLV